MISTRNVVTGAMFDIGMVSLPLILILILPPLAVRLFQACRLGRLAHGLSNLFSYSATLHLWSD